jgi:hypothetical protein
VQQRHDININLFASGDMPSSSSISAFFYSPSKYFGISNSIFWSSVFYFSVYGLLAKKKLPKSTWKVLSRFYFWPMLPITYISRNLPWSPPYFVEVSPGVILGGVPIVFAGHVDELYKLGVRGVINMQDEYHGPIKKYEELGITQNRLPCVDHVEPTVEQMVNACTFITEQREKGHKVYVHCKGGHGRGGAIAFAWILKVCGRTLKETQDMLSNQRKVRSTLYKQQNIIEFYNRHCDRSTG